MTDIVLSLTNVRTDAGQLRYEHLFPATAPRWRFAQFHDAATEPHLQGDDDALRLTATPRGPRVVGVDYGGPLALWIVMTNPAKGKEDEFNVWYDDRHIADTLALPGLTAARRYTVKDVAGPNDARWSYLAIYEIELERVGEALAEAAVRAGGPRMRNPGMLAPGTVALPFRPIDLCASRH